MIARASRRLGHGFLVFLEVIGLREEGRSDQELQLSRFRLYHTEFRKLISANNSFLETIAELERKLLAPEFFDRSYVKRKVVRAVADVHAMAASLEAISGGAYPGLRAALEKITAALTGAIAEPDAAAQEELVLDLGTISSSLADLAGGKMANLGEVRNGLGLPTPDGFVVTTSAFRALLEEAGVRSALHEELSLQESADAASERNRSLMLLAPVDKPLEAAILAAYDRLAQRLGAAPSVAVRSSALGEDGSRSFAGQFLTVLNVSRDGLIDAYRQVLASLYSPEATHYRRLHGMPPESAAMAVGFLAMVDAVAAGVVFSREPSDASSKQLLIHAVRGLGATLVDGDTLPEAIWIAREGEPAITGRSPSRQTSRLACRAGEGLGQEEVSPSLAAQPCLTDAQALRLGRWALALEAHFGGPQDVEWALAADGSLTLLQSRPLRIAGAAVRAREPVAGATVLLRGGDTACPGVAAGVAVHMEQDGDLEAFPDGGVLVARRSSPRFVRVMAKVSAIVTDAGSTTGHMASLARELRIPTLLATGTGTAAIPDGATVTVDAASGCVYAGVLAELLARGEPAPAEGGYQLQLTPERSLLERAVELLVPLNLSEPRAPDFTVERARTLHDLARFVHEKSYEEMFRMGETLGDLRPSSYLLDVFLPVDLYIIDLGGGLLAPARGRKVKPTHVTSTPLAALLRGMLDRRIPRFGPRPMDLGGLVSIMMRHALSSPEQERTFRDPCYALVSENYLNYTARVGYHFGAVDAYCSETANKNYISMQFRGGAADRARRSRRVRAIAGILRHSGFSVDVIHDLVTARLNKPPQAEAVAQLEMLGRLLQFFRQMDVAMSSEAAVEWVQEAFLAGNLDLR